MAILAVALVFGLALASCSGDSEADKSLEGLFDSIKDASPYTIWAYNGSGYIGWCTEHKRWEGEDSQGYKQHELPPAFAFSEAITLSGGSYWLPGDENANSAKAKDLIKKLDGFYPSKYKTDAPTQKMNWSNLPDGTNVIVWYTYYLRSDGTGGYGASATPVEAPLYRNYYKF